jgi:anti-sigma B factor antagonist
MTTSGQAPPGMLGLAAERGPDGLDVLVVTGDLDLAEAHLLGAAVRDRLADPAPSVLLIDLCGVSFLDSSGLDQLLDARTRCARRGVGLCLLAPDNRAVLRPLRITGLDAVFTLVESRAGAVGCAARR